MHEFPQYMHYQANIGNIPQQCLMISGTQEVSRALTDHDTDGVRIT